MDYDDLTRKKKQLDLLRPFPEALVKNLEEWFWVELTYSSNALEGNTLTRQETALVVEKGLTIGGKSITEHLEAANHARALDLVKRLALKRPDQLSEKDILEIHATLLKGIDDQNAGSYRSIAVRISGSNTILPNHAKVPRLMEEFMVWLHVQEDKHPAELASEAHYRLVSIHPFTDGNGRTARLLMNLLLMQQGYPPALIRKQDRLTYLSALEQAQGGGSMDDYNTIIIRAVNRSVDIYLKSCQENQDQPVSTELLTIGKLAGKANEAVSTLRYWTKLGLIEVQETTPSGYQLYSEDMIRQIKQIRDYQSKRYTLKEIKQILQ